MTRLVWGTSGERFFESGADRGVLFIDDRAGVPWNGLRSVSEAANGGEARPYYIDGYKYLNIAAAEEFRATIKAFSSPREFAVCDGTLGIHNGLFVTQQPRRPFSLSYRTLVGNDISGTDHGYKIHIVYNALAAPSSRENTTLSTSATPVDLSWDITTTPPKITGLRPTAHFVIDSRYTPPKLLTHIEDILYGAVGQESRLPSVEELVELFSGPAPLAATNMALNPDVVDLNGFSSSASQNTLTYENDAAHFSLDITGPIGIYAAVGVPFVVGETYRLLIQARANKLLNVRPRIRGTNAPIQEINEDYRWYDFTLVCGNGNVNQTGFVVNTGPSWGPGDWIEINKVAYFEPGYTGPHFSGNKPSDEFAQYSWKGAVNNSYSYMNSWYY